MVPESLLAEAEQLLATHRLKGIWAGGLIAAAALTAIDNVGGTHDRVQMIRARV